jgi:arylsulfatase A-like enzyme
MTKHAAVAALAISWIAACGGGDGGGRSAAKGTDGSGSAGAPHAGSGSAVQAAPAPADPNRVEHAVWHLLDNRHAAHREVDGDLVIDAGGAALARYTRFGLPKAGNWKLRAPIVDAAGAPTGEVGGRFNRLGHLELPLTEAQAGARSIWLRVHSTKVGKLSVRVGDEKQGKLARAALAPGWNVVALPMATGWHVGENDVQVLSDLDGDDVHLGWIMVSRKEAPTGDVLDPQPLAKATFAGEQLTLAPGAGLSWYVQVPAGAVLVGDSSGAIEVTTISAGGPGSTGTLHGPGARVDLSALEGQVVRLSFTNPGKTPATLRGAHIALAGPAAVAAPSGPPPTYVLWWIWDSTRADKIPLFQPGGRARTPNLDKLAKTGAVFRQHYVGGNESQTSHSSMFTSLYPAVHDVRTAGNDVHYRIPHKYPTLGELMSQAGFYTIGVTGNGYVGQFGGYARGFTEFRNMMQEKGVVNARLPGQLLSDEMIRRLNQHVGEGKPAKRLMMYLGTVDSHSPWVARKPWIDEYDTSGYQGPFETAALPGPLGMVKGKMGCGRVPPKAEVDRLRAIYDSTISYQDERLGEVLAELERLGIAEQTMVIVTADHGDELFEEKRCGHGASLRDSLARVPLLIHYPPRVATRIVDEGSEGLDILPTVLAAVDAPPLATAQGRSLLPLAAGAGAGWPTPSFASQYEYAFAMRIGPWKARVMRGAPQVYDMASDPDERTDLSASRPIERRYLTDYLALFLAHRNDWQRAEWGVATNLTAAGAAALDAPTGPGARP